MYKIEIENRCLKEIKKLDKKSVKKAFEIIEKKIAVDPYNAKRLTGPYTGLFSYRFQDYRIIYEIFEKKITVLVLRIRHRKNAYDGL